MNNTSHVYPDATNRIYHVTSDTVTIDITGNWPKAFELMQELGRRLGFHRVKILSIIDRRTQEQLSGKQ